eukprot:CAMPEP_0202361692 /NCGR_PEP_ID=MMETSP1126-20121109/14152_1 /ASSEMBLY_ACC=CAM_ASM_000457 /TAXON_ID=3047 /ORGANISM="Dunaliella tertiolecta, Strain CCMP1320" /LENGTH=38 /DNA_ID= /DNA_START= /DNA_END= /DNA_ORIENTATION=
MKLAALLLQEERVEQGGKAVQAILRVGQSQCLQTGVRG